MKNLIQKTEDLFMLSLITGVLVFLVSLTTVLLWTKDGISLLEVAFMPIISGLYYFILIIVANIIGLNRYIRTTVRDGRTPIIRTLQVLFVLIVSFIIYVFLDSSYFMFDNSISSDYAEALIELSEKNNGSVDIDSVSGFAQIPFSLQNGIITFVFAFIGSLISLIFIKKDGVLMRTAEYYQ